MGLGKDTGSTRINRYESQASAIGFESLEQLAKTLNVPPAYLLAESAPMADAILALSGHPEQARLAAMLQVLQAMPALADGVLMLAELPERQREQALAALRMLAGDAAGDG